MWECVKQAYVDHLSDISTDNLPEEIQIFYDSVKLRVTAVEPSGHIGNDEVSYIANDISRHLTKDRRSGDDRRKILNKRRTKGPERRHYFKD
jgi:hypothetical protein